MQGLVRAQLIVLVLQYPKTSQGFRRSRLNLGHFGAYFATISIHVDTIISRTCICFLDSTQALVSHLRLQDAFPQRRGWLAVFLSHD